MRVSSCVLFLTLWASGVVGCATFGSAEQVISVQSRPSGLQFSLHPRVKGSIGRTPFFLQSTGAPNLRIFADLGEGRSRRLDISCDFSWQKAILGNLPVSASLGPAFGGMFFGAALAVDIFSESAYECPPFAGLDARRFNVSATAVTKNKRECRKILIVPPYHLSFSSSLRIVQFWKQGIRQSLKPCDRILEEPDAIQVMAAEGLTFDRPSTLKGMERSALNRIGFKTGATHLAVLQVKETNRATVLLSSLRDLHSLRFESLRPVRVEEQSLQVSPFWEVLDQSVWILPNAGMFSTIWGWPQYDQAQASYQFLQEEDGRDYLSFLAGWELSHLPDIHLKPENALTFQTSLSLWSHLVQRAVKMYWRYSNVDPSDGVTVIDETMNVWYLGATLENRIYFFTEYLSPFAGFGAGILRSQLTLKSVMSSRIMPVFQGYFGFLSPTGRSSFFELMGGYRFSSDAHVASRYTSFAELFYVQAKAGVYMPAFRNMLRRVF